MEPYAVVETGGKQHLVRKGDVLAVERLDADAGKKVTSPRILAVSDGKSLTLGAPEVKGAKVTFKVVEHMRGKKVVSFKKKRRKGYSRKIGHRQELTSLSVEKIG